MYQKLQNFFNRAFIKYAYFFAVLYVHAYSSTNQKDVVNGEELSRKASFFCTNNNNCISNMDEIGIDGMTTGDSGDEDDFSDGPCLFVEEGKVGSFGEEIYFDAKIYLTSSSSAYTSFDEEDYELSELDDAFTVKRHKSDKGGIQRQTSEGASQLYSSSQPYYLNSSSPLHNPCISVDTFLKKCANFLGIEGCGREERIFTYEEKDVVNVVLRENGKRVKCRVYDPYHKLMNGQQFCPPKKPRGGTRETGIYPIDGRDCIFFKQWPEAPEREKAAYDLYLELFPEDNGNVPFPKSQTILMNNQVFLISEFIEGETLEEVFEKVKVNPEYGKDWCFDIEKLQKVLIVCSIICPEDLRPQNCLLKQDARNNKWRFIPVDNERSIPEKDYIEYYHPMLGKISTRVHCSLLCFYELLKERNKVNLSMNIATALERWTTKLWKETQYLQKLKRHLDRNNVLTRSNLGIFYSSDRKKEMANRMKKIVRVCSVKESLFSHVLWGIDPQLAAIYRIPTIYSAVSSGNILSLAYSRISEIDAGRTGLVVPPSAEIPLDVYFHGPKFLKSASSANSLLSLKVIPPKMHRQHSV